MISAVSGLLNKAKRTITREEWMSLIAPCLVMALVAYIYYFVNPERVNHFDYQFRMAGELLHGHLGLAKPISWLSELVPANGRYTSAFPLGSVLTFIPIVLLQQWRNIPYAPTREIISLLAGTIALLLYLLSRRYADSLIRRLMLVFLIVCGSWMWCNLVIGGAWQLALGIAVCGEVGALVFTLVEPRPLLAGFFFALAFGSRTEIALTAPLFLYLLLRHDPCRDGEMTQPIPFPQQVLTRWRQIIAFLLFPTVLGIATLWYNYARFHSFSDFGYTHIPGMMTLPGYEHGLFSPFAIPMNVQTMLFASPWEPLPHFPFFFPQTRGGSIFAACPFLVLLLRDGGRDRALRITAWSAIAILTLVLWLHGNTGDWQFGYRYAMILLPWFFVLLLDQRGGRVTALEIFLFLLSLATNALAVYVFFWTKLIQ